MNRLKPFILGGLLAALATVANATPIPFSALGTAKTVVVSSRPYLAGNGGGFAATIDGYATTVWCVDSQNFISPGQPSAIYLANVIALGPWALGQNVLVQKGTNPAWSDGNTYTPLQRYQAAAWLVEQYNNFPLGPNNTAGDVSLQDAIWRMTHATGGGGTFPGVNADYIAAQTFLGTIPAATFGFTKWAVVSGVVDGNGNLDIENKRQTFLVQYDGAVPEPSTYASMALALAGVAVGLRRRKSA